MENDYLDMTATDAVRLVRHCEMRKKAYGVRLSGTLSRIYEAGVSGKRTLIDDGISDEILSDWLQELEERGFQVRQSSDAEKGGRRDRCFVISW